MTGPLKIARSRLRPLEQFESGARAHVELIFGLGAGRGRIVIGWLYDPAGAVSAWLALPAADVAGERVTADAAGELVAVPLRDGVDSVRVAVTARPDVSAAMGRVATDAADHRHGFVIYLPDRHDRDTLAVLLADDAAGTLDCPAEATGDALVQALRSCWPHAGRSVRAIVGESGAESPVLDLLEEFASRRFEELFPDMTQSRHDPRTAFASADHAFCLGEAGVLVTGWHFEPAARLRSVTVNGPEGRRCDVTRGMCAIQRRDVQQQLREKYPDVGELRGFLCYAPLPTDPGEPRALCFEFDDATELWLKLPTDVPRRSGLALVREMLEAVPSPENLRHSLHAFYDNGFGAAIEAVGALDRELPRLLECTQYGEPPAQPAVTVIVPLYGRYDFIRHQLVHFADDADFRSVDLVYVVDDPAIVGPARDMAAACHQLLGTPFRVASYGRNIGFAGANNVGASLARADTLLLLNSDVIPRQQGWIAELKAVLDTTPAAGAVGPLLQFCDDSVQHAGMAPRRDPFLPGFLLNVHPGKGRPWSGPDTPSRQPLLTAACLMLRKADYLDCGGLDEGYLLGDFEDSDLCLALRKRGLALWLAPRAKLWHLERQSQGVNSSSGFRQLLTLFNGWRYQRKIRDGIIADPEADGTDDAHTDL